MLETAPLPPPAPLTEEEKIRRVSEEALTWRRLHRVSPPCPGPAYLCWIPSPAAYRTVLASGWLQKNRQFWRLGLWSRCCSARSCLSPPCFVTTDPAEHTWPPHTSPEAGGHSKFWTMWAKVLSPALSSFPTQGQQRLAGVWGSHGLALTLIRVRGLGHQSIDLSFLPVPSRGHHCWHTGGSISVPSLLEAVSEQLIIDCVVFTCHSTPLWSLGVSLTETQYGAWYLVTT